MYNNKDERISMVIRLLKIIKLKKELSVPAEAIHEPGVLSGYTCPRCGRHHCIHDFCLACGQRLAYDYAPHSYIIKRYSDVDEMCEKMDEVFNELITNNEAYREFVQQGENGFGSKFESLKNQRQKCKIMLSDLTNNERQKE